MTLDAEQQKRALAIAIFSFSFCYSYWMYGIKPTELKIKTRGEQIAQLKDQIIQAKIQARRLPEIKREYDEMKIQIADIDKQLPKDSDLPGLLRFLSQQVGRFHLTLKTLVPGNTLQDTLYQSFQIQITMTGRFHNVGRFLAALGTQERILSADTLRINQAASDASEANVQASFNMIAYASKG
jgi:type IV pilus assembly protein PilO